jgi:hypothetical protein
VLIQLTRQNRVRSLFQDAILRLVRLNGLSVGERGLAATDGLDAMLGETVLRAPGFTLRGGTRGIFRGMIAKGMGLR